MAAEHDLDLTQIEGTGRGGRVTKKDVLAYLDNGGGAEKPEPPMHIESPYRPDPPAPKPGAATEAAPGQLSRMRRSIGQHMLESLHTAAHCTTIVEADMSGVERRRKQIGSTYLPVVAGCVVDALREFPQLNAWLEGENYTQHEAVHLGIAVSLGEDGLIVPVVHDAQDLSDSGLAKRIKDLASRAREKQLVPDEVRGGTFTITNPGAFGAIAATPIINQPQVAILDLEAVVKRPVVVTDAEGNDAIAIRPMTNLCMSWDHRAIDGAYAAQFLTAVRRKLEAL
jgi:2-oxoglutarate dehydrogenase E2 component (dihydrolipoamide succinyltransferase)